MPSPASHEWIIGPAERGSARSATPHGSIIVDAHRHLRGPYTAAGTLIRQLLPNAWKVAPDLVHEHALTLVTVSPETSAVVPVADTVLTWFSFPREGTLPGMTLRLAHGVAEFLLGCVDQTPAASHSVTFERVQHAETLDREFMAVLLRRADPRRLRVRIATDSENIPDPLRSALTEYATISRPERIGSSPHVSSPERVIEGKDAGFRTALARRYVESDCTSDDPLLERAYAVCSDAERRQLHIDRAAALTARNEPSLSLGAIPLHCERAGTGIDTFVSASLHCLTRAFYEACLDLAHRGRRLASPVADRDAYGYLSRHELFAQLMLGRLDDVEAFCRECETITDDPFLLTHCAYARAMLHLRFYDPARRDPAMARIWVEKALAFTGQRASSTDRNVNLAFLRNTMALVELREGRTARAFELLDDAIAFLQQEAPEAVRVESPILYRNRAKLHERHGDSDAAIADLETAIQYDCGYAPTHLEIAGLLRRRGRPAEALEHCDTAIKWSPPWAVAYQHRALAYAALGRVDDALADYDRALTLDPAHLDTLADRATLCYRLDRLDAARADIERGLAIDKTYSRLLCLRGYIERREGRVDEAIRSFTEALAQKPPLPEVLAGAMRRWLEASAGAPLQP